MQTDRLGARVADSSTPTVLSQIRELMKGDVVGNYRIDEPLGAGGMANVYAVTHVHVGTRAALKIPQHGLEPAMAQRFLVEARAHLGLVGSPHIVPPMEVAMAPDGRPYLVTRLMASTLHSWKQDPRNELEDADQELSQWLRFGIQIALGLEAAHGQQPSIIHRDLKPPNIYVDPKTTVIDGKEVPLVQIGDFGLAWSPGDENTPMGTPEYVAPEHASGAPPTARSDLYSLGIVLFELIEGHVPFEGADIKETLLMQQRSPIPRMQNSVVMNRVPELQDLMDRLLAKSEAERPATARVVVNDLLSILRHFERRDERTTVGVDPRKIAPTTKIPQVGQPVESGRLDPRAVPLSKRLAVPILALLALVVLGVIGVKVLGGEPEKIDVVKIENSPKADGPPKAETPPKGDAPPKAESPTEPKRVDPPVIAELQPVVFDSGIGADELAAVKGGVARVVKATPAIECVVDDRWREGVKFDLQSIKSWVAAKVPDKFGDIEDAEETILALTERAKTQDDCRAVVQKIQAARKLAGVK